MEQSVFTTNSFEETQKVGEEFAKMLHLGGVTLIALYGELGSGKTTFIQGLAKGLGIKKRIISPTFIIIKTYKLQNQNFFYHIDLYRVQSMDDIKGLGIDEIINNTQNIVAIEWAEKMGKLLPKKRVDIYFEYVDEEKRKIKIDTLMNKAIEKAVKILKEGGIVIFPTDTAFGIGCRINDEKAIERLFKICGKPKNQAVPVLVDTLKMVQNYLLPIPKEVINKLIKPYWPGGLTIVLSCRIDRVPSLVRGENMTLGVRIPDHPLTRELIRRVGVPILGPSANFHQGKTPYKFEDLNPKLLSLADYVIPGTTSSEGLASTVVDCSKKPWKILRQGAIKIQNSKRRVVLLIDTSSNKEVMVSLKINSQEYVQKQKVGWQKAQAILPMIEKILKKHSLRLEDLKEIEVNTGPGSFTGLRVGLTVANTLAFSLGIPVNGKKVGEFVMPLYE